MRGIVTMTRDKYYPNNSKFLGALATPSDCALRDTVHLPKLSDDAYDIDSKYFDWKDLFDKLIQRNFGAKYIMGRRDPGQYFAELSDLVNYAIMSMGEIKVTLSGSCRNRSEVYKPNNIFRIPIQAGR